MSVETPSRSWLIPVAALLAATFCIVSAELAVAGLLPAIAGDLEVSIPVAGLLISGYAIGVAVAGPILSLLTSRLSRRLVLCGIMGVYIVGSILCALATSYWTLFGARLVLSACHGLHFGVAMVVATRVAPPGRQATAISLVVAGVSAATILGVPMGTAIGNAFGWRTTFWVMAALGVVALLVLLRFVPGGSTERGASPSLRAELKAAGRPGALFCYGIFALLLVSYFAVLAYIVPYLTDVSGVPVNVVPWVLLAMGLATLAGTLLGGALGDRFPAPTMIGAFTFLIVWLVLLWQFGSNPWLASLFLVLAWLSAFCIPSSLQSRLMREASDAPNFASTLMNTASQVGIAVGAALGGLVIAQGWGFAPLPLISAAVLVPGLAATLVLVASDRRRKLVPA